MVEFQKKILHNGLTVISHCDKSSPFVNFNLLYKVGARNENPNRTGFAHLFEHLMFGGSKNIENPDREVQLASGNFNAFTNNDYTNYYMTLPRENIETAFWIDSDRMDSLAFTPKSLEVQRSVVIEEFKQRYLNQPYGDFWLLLRPLAYKRHPYQWATIGKDISHIENAKMQEVKDFFYSFYAPNNAILSVVGDIQAHEVFELSEKWFGDIERRKIRREKLPIEPEQTQKRTLKVERDVPFDTIYMAFHKSDRFSRRYDLANLLSDILSNGKSSRLSQHLVREKKIFNQISAYISGSLDAGLFIIKADLLPTTSMETAETAIWEELKDLKQNLVSDYELQKIKNRLESMLVFNDMSLLNKAMQLSYFEMLGNTNLINKEIETLQRIQASELQKEAKLIFKEENCSVLNYFSKKNKKTAKSAKKTS